MSKTKTPAAKVILGDGTLSKDEEERLALLMILHLADRNIAWGKTTPLAVVMKRVRARLRQRNKEEIAPGRPPQRYADFANQTLVGRLG